MLPILSVDVDVVVVRFIMMMVLVYLSCLVEIITNQSNGNEYQITFNGNIAIPEGGTVGPIAVAIMINGETDVASRSIFTPAAVDEFGNVTSTTVIKVPKCCGCFTVSVDYVSGIVDDPAAVPAPSILVENGNLTIDGKVAQKGGNKIG